MEFNVVRRKHPNLPKYPTDDLFSARKFVAELQKELGDFLKAAVMFGSAARQSYLKEPLQQIMGHDIDVLLIINDLSMIASEEVVQAYRIIVQQVATKVSHRLHINTLKLTTFWDYIRMGDPIVINMLRDGVPLLDAGFFEPLQHLLFEGRIRPTKEAMWTYFSRAPLTLQNAEWHVQQATLDLYWAVIDAAHAVLMKVGEIPPTPAHVADLLEHRFVKRKLMSQKYVDSMRFFFDLGKKITHKEIGTITGTQYEHYQALARDFVREMKRLIGERHLE